MARWHTASWARTRRRVDPLLLDTSAPSGNKRCIIRLLSYLSVTIGQAVVILTIIKAEMDLPRPEIEPECEL